MNLLYNEASGILLTQIPFQGLFLSIHNFVFFFIMKAPKFILIQASQNQDLPLLGPVYTLVGEFCTSKAVLFIFISIAHIRHFIAGFGMNEWPRNPEKDWKGRERLAETRHRRWSSEQGAPRSPQNSKERTCARTPGSEQGHESGLT